MQLESRVYSSPKAGNSSNEYEDAFASSEQVVEVEYRYSIADGATESSFADIWAKILADDYCFGEFDFDSLSECIKRLTLRWQKKVHTKDLPWYALEKLESGAFSSLAGVALTEVTETEMQAEMAAIGDSCIFHIRDGVLLSAFPLESAEDFNNSPALISSNPERNKGLEEHIKKRSVAATQGDSFYLMTDALSCWLLRRYKEDPNVLQRMNDLQEDEKFYRLIEQERSVPYEEGGYYLRNDDVTFIRVKLR